jgi:multiple sugar transport system substrate-binding protein
LFYEAGWYTDLQPFLDDPTLTAVDYDWPEDYPASSLVGSLVQDTQVMIPIDRALPPIVYYRKDLFQEYGIPTPESLGDLEEAAKTIYEKTDGQIYGMVNRGQGAGATSQFRHVLHEFGAKWNDLETGKPTVNTPEAVAAFDWWGRTLREYGPPGVTSYQWYETINEFLQGKAAISLEGALNAGVVEDPDQSLVVGKVGYLPMLPGPGGGEQVRNYPPRKESVAGLAISSLSEKKEAAWYFVQWMTNKEAGLQYLLTGKQSARKSAWEDERFLSTTNPEWAEAMIVASEYSYATPCYAPCSIKDVAQARDIIGEVIVSSILGEDVKAAADKAQAELVDLWEQEQAAQ